MFIDEMQVGSEVTVEAANGSKKIALKTEVVDIDPQLRQVMARRARILPVRLLEKDGKQMSFPKGIHYSAIVSSEGNPYIWHDLSIQMIQHPQTGERYHVIVTNQEGRQFNRRENYRLYMGCDGTAQIGSNGQAMSVVIKDLSAQGVGFVMHKKDAEKIAVGDKVHLKFDDGVEFLNTKFDLVTTVVRMVELEGEERVLVGCQQDKYSDSLNKYVSNKQRERMKKQRA